MTDSIDRSFGRRANDAAASPEGPSDDATARNTAILNKFRRLFLALTVEQQVEFLRRLNPALLETALESRPSVLVDNVRRESAGAPQGDQGGGRPWFAHAAPPDTKRKDIDQRGARRMAVSLEARVVYDDGLTSRDCVVTELSDWGCKLTLADAYDVPDRFRLADRQNVSARDCLCVWRRGDEIGVEFVDA